MPNIFKPKLRKKNKAHKKNFRRDIQALRALAVTAVVLYHLWPDHLKGGFTGVDIFFVISGYLMTLSIMKRLNPLAKSRQINIKSVGGLLAEFYARRIKRLVPAALTALIGVITLSWLSGSYNVLLTNAKNVVSSATFWENWLLAKDSVSYHHQNNLITGTLHFWSLSLEEQFYLLWPILLIVSTIITSSIVIYYKRKAISGVILPVTLATLLSLAYGVWLTQSDHTIAYYSTPARIWELMVGGIIALLPVIKNYDLKLLLPYLGFVIDIYSIFFIGSDNFPGWVALLPVVGTSMIIMAGTDKGKSSISFDVILGWKPIQWLGNISYSVYLWHYPLLVLLPLAFGRDIDGPHSTLIKFGLIAVSLLAAQLSYTLIEQPTQKVQIKTRYIYLLFLILTSLVAGGSYAIHQQTKEQINPKNMHEAAIKTDDECFGGKAILNSDKCGNPYGKKDSKFMMVGESDDFKNLIEDGFDRCNNLYDADNDDQNSFCVVGDTDAKKSIVLFGDSHAQQYLNAFDAIGKRNNYKVYLFDVISCTGKDFMKKPEPCKKRYDAMKKSGQFKKSSLVVISFLARDYDYLKKNINFVRKHTNSKIALLQDDAHTTVERLSDCYTLANDCSIKKDKATKQPNKVLDELLDKKVVNKNQVIDTHDFFCDDTKCYSSIGGAPVYYNTKDEHDGTTNSHITASFSLSVAKLIEERLNAKHLL